MQIMLIAFRNVVRQLKRSLLLGGAVAFGFFIFTLINGFTGGLINTVEVNVADAAGGHIYVEGSEVSDLGSEITVIRDTTVVEEAVAVLGNKVETLSYRSQANGTLIFGGNEETEWLVGVDITQEESLLDSLAFVEGAPSDFLAIETGLLLPQETVTKLGLEVGESVIVKATTVNGQINVGDFIVTGAIQGNEDFGFSYGYARIEGLNNLLDMAPDQYQTLSLYLNDLTEIDSLTETLFNEIGKTAATVPRGQQERGPDFAEWFEIGGLTTIDEEERWRGTKFEITNVNEALEGLNDLVRTMNTIALVIFLVIIVIIMVGVINSYRMVMIERTSEIGTMRAMGVHRAGIRNIFIWEAFFIAFSGAIVGLIFALLAMVGISLVNFGPNDFSFFLRQGSINFSITPSSTVFNLLLICFMSVASVLIPATAAARLKPAEALRATH